MPVVALDELKKRGDAFIADLDGKLQTKITALDGELEDVKAKHIAELNTLLTTENDALKAILNGSPDGALTKLRNLLNDPDTGSIAKLDAVFNAPDTGALAKLEALNRDNLAQTDKLLKDSTAAVKQMVEEKIAEGSAALQDQISSHAAMLDTKIAETDKKVTEWIAEVKKEVVETAAEKAQAVVNAAKRTFTRSVIVILDLLFLALLGYALTTGAIDYTTSNWQAGSFLLAVFYLVSIIFLFSNSMLNKVLGIKE